MHLPPEVLSILLEAHLTPEQLALVKRAMAILVAPVEEARLKANAKKARQRARKRLSTGTGGGQSLGTSLGTEPSKINGVARVKDNPLPSSPPPADGAKAPSAVVGAPARKAKPRTPIPADWQLDEDDWTYARKYIPEAYIPEQGEHFRDHHTAHGKLMADWKAAWRTWCRNYATFTGRKGNSNGQAIIGHNRRVITEFLADEQAKRERRGAGDSPDLFLIQGGPEIEQGPDEDGKGRVSRLLKR